MLNSLKVKPKKPGRQLLLDSWLVLNQIQKQDIAKKIGVSNAFIGAVLAEKRAMPLKRFQQLKELGIPEDLLPSPKSARARGGFGEDSGVS